MKTESQSLLAKLLATENITVQQTPGIKTAMFDLKNRVLMMPIWANVSKDLEDLLLGHETGHALDTPVGEYKEAIETITKNVFGDEKLSKRLQSTVGGFLNVIEDARIDKRQKRRYPGLRKNYLIGYKELMDRDFFGTAKRDVNSMTFIDRVNLYFKGGSIHLNLEFSPAEKVFLRRIESLETFPETVTLTEEIYRFCKEELEKQQTMENDLYEGEEEEYYDEYDSDNDGDGDVTDEMEDGNDEGQDGQGEGDEEDSKSDGEQGQGNLKSEGDNSAAAGLEGSPSHDDEIAPESKTDAAWQEKIQSLVKDENNTYVYVNMPKINWDKAVNDYKVVLEDWKNSIDKPNWNGVTKDQLEIARKQFTQWRMKEKDSISFMVKEFEQRKAAEMYSRTQVAKTGVIDTNKLHTYKFNDDIFRRITTIPQGKNHGFIMFLDWSGSMNYGLKDTVKQLLSLCLFCKQIQVPFEVYAFKDSGTDNPFTAIGQNNVLRFGNVVLRNFISSRMKTEEFNFAASVLWSIGMGGNISSDGMGGTPLNEAIIIAPHMVKEFQRKNKLEIVNTIFLTDGEGNGIGSVLENDVNPAGRKSYKDKHFYNDPETGKTYELDFYNWGQSITPTLLKILKDKTQSNLVGFFLFNSGFRYLSSRLGLRNGSAEYMSKVKKFWNDNKFFAVTSEGYDEYYYINCDAMKDDKVELEITEKTKTNKQLAKAFSKFASKKVVNRVLLRQFIEKVAGMSTRKVA
jgi:hypothetical protein